MNPNDPDVIALSKAIFQRESGGNFNAVGDAGTSHGAGQWQPGTWKAQAKDVLGDENAPMTPQNQKAVIQVTVAKRKAAGLNPAQIAAEWNSGRSTGWENHVGTTTINGQQIHYDTPRYVKDVTDLYHQYKGSQGYNPTPYSNPTDGSSPFTLDLSGQAPAEQNDGLGAKLMKRGTDISESIRQAGAGEMAAPIISAPLQVAGSIAGSVGDVVGAGLELIPGVKQLEGAIGSGVQKAADTELGQKVVKGITDFSAKHPELSKDIGAVGNIATAIPIVKGIGLAKNAAVSGLKTGLVGSTDAVYEAVAPKLGPKGLAKAIQKQGTSQKGVLRKTVLNESPQVQKIAETVKTEVPGFNPGAPIVEQINQVQKAVDASVESLKNDVVRSGADRIFSPNELKGVLNKIETPISLRGTAFEKQLKPLKDAFVRISEEEGGKVSSLLPAIQRFDQLITKTYGDAFWTREAAPMRQAVREMRDAVAQFAEQRLPQGLGFRERRLIQSRLIKAIENMSEKAAAGVTKEIGTTAPSRFLGRSPLIRAGLKGAARAIETGLGVKGAEALIP